MQFAHRVRDDSATVVLSSALKFSVESSTLARKLAAQIQWMQKRGIDMRLRESERPCLPKKPTLPGTIIYFSRSF